LMVERNSQYSWAALYHSTSCCWSMLLSALLEHGVALLQVAPQAALVAELVVELFRVDRDLLLRHFIEGANFELLDVGLLVGLLCPGFSLVESLQLTHG
jgi:hypothetical protein